MNGRHTGVGGWLPHSLGGLVVLVICLDRLAYLVEELVVPVAVLLVLVIVTRIVFHVTRRW